MALKWEQEEYTTAQLAQILGIPTTMIVQDIMSGTLKAEKRERYWMIAASDARAYITYRRNIRQSISAREFAHRTGQQRHFIEQIVKQGEIPAFKHSHKVTSSWHILECDVIAYCDKVGWTYQERVIPRRRKNVVSLSSEVSEHCGACGQGGVNILGDVDEKSHQHYGYLCPRCIKIVRVVRGEKKRVEQVLLYLKRTRSSVA